MIYILVKFIANILSALNRSKPIKDDRKYQTFYGSMPPEKILNSLIHTYRLVFSEPPWSEEWSIEKVEQKIKKEVAETPNSFITVMLNQEEVVGFAWGSILKKEELPRRVEETLELEFQELENFDKKLLNMSSKEENILYFDEFAIHKHHRGGINPVRHLFVPGLKKAKKHKVKEMLFWSTPESKIVPLSNAIGFKVVHEHLAKNLEVVFLFYPNVYDLLKLMENLSDKMIKRILKIISKISK